MKPLMSEVFYFSIFLFIFYFVINISILWITYRSEFQNKIKLLDTVKCIMKFIYVV